MLSIFLVTGILNYNALSFSNQMSRQREFLIFILSIHFRFYFTCRLSGKSCFGKCCFNKFSVADQILTTHSFKIEFMSTFFQQFIKEIFH